jgi:hypothetical protein
MPVYTFYLSQPDQARRFIRQIKQQVNRFVPASATLIPVSDQYIQFSVPVEDVQANRFFCSLGLNDTFERHGLKPLYLTMMH